MVNIRWDFVLCREARGEEFSGDLIGRFFDSTMLTVSTLAIFLKSGTIGGGSLRGDVVKIIKVGGQKVLVVKTLSCRHCGCQFHLGDSNKHEVHSICLERCCFAIQCSCGELVRFRKFSFFGLFTLLYPIRISCAWDGDVLG